MRGKTKGRGINYAGAGDIDGLVEPIQKIIEQRN
jgi:hypothetical protein